MAYTRYLHAQSHLETLRMHLENAEKLENFDLLPNPDGSGDAIIRFKAYPTILLSLVLGDVIHSLRSALDYVTCALVTLHTPDATLTRIQFPFGRDGQRLNSDERKSVKGISDIALTAIENMRSQYREGLALLCAFSNQDKHRLLLPAYSHLVSYKFQFDEKTSDMTIMPVQSQDGKELKTILRDGDHVNLSDGFIKAVRVGFRLEAGERSYGADSIDLINNAVRETLNVLIPLSVDTKQA